MDWSGVSGLVTKMAPTIATALGGPLAGGAVSALEGVFGLNTSGDTSDKQTALAAAIAGATPDQLAAMKKADNDFLVQMQALGFKDKEDMAQMVLNDTDSARKREETVKDVTPTILAYAITLGFFGILTAIMLGYVPTSAKEILDIMLGTLGTAWVAVISYYFGSSAGDAHKTELLSKADAIK